MANFMNPQRGRHMSGSEEEHGSHGAKPHIFVHSHKNGHTVHVFHHDGRHEMHEHGHGEAESIADKVHESLGGEQRPESDGLNPEADGGQSI